MSKPLTPREIVIRFYRDRLLFCSLGCVVVSGFVVLLASLGMRGVVSFPLWVLQVPTIVIIIGAMIKIFSLGDCPACGRNISLNSRDPFPMRCQSCGVRLLSLK